MLTQGATGTLQGQVLHVRGQAGSMGSYPRMTGTGVRRPFPKPASTLGGNEQTRVHRQVIAFQGTWDQGSGTRSLYVGPCSFAGWIFSQCRLPAAISSLMPHKAQIRARDGVTRPGPALRCDVVCRTDGGCLPRKPAAGRRAAGK